MIRSNTVQIPKSGGKEILPARKGRRGIIIRNTGNQTLYIFYGRRQATAELFTHALVATTGEVVDMESGYDGPVTYHLASAITSGAACITEVYDDEV